MNAKSLLAAASITIIGLAALSSAMAIAKDKDKDKEKDKSPAGKQEHKLPPGWTEADMQACELAATPGKMHELLAKEAGVWQGKNTMWMSPEAEPMVTECSSTVTPILGGRFIQQEIAGEMPGMGPYTGLAIVGYDNVSEQFVSTWIDNCGTGMALGEGKLSADGKTLNWKFTYNCPVRKKPVVMRQVETVAAAGKKTVDLFASDPKSGKEFKMMRFEQERKK